MDRHMGLRPLLRQIVDGGRQRGPALRIESRAAERNRKRA
jgi:hypothetical protein